MYQSSLSTALIRSFKGEEGKADYVDLANGFIGPTDLAVIAKALQYYNSTHSGASSVIELNLSFNQICGVNSRGEGIYDSSGFAALVLVLSTSRVLKTLVLDQNYLAIPGCALLGEMLSTQCPLKTLKIRRCKISMEGAMEIAKGLRTNKFLTSLDLSGNPLCAPGVSHICQAINDNVKGALQMLNLSNTGIDVEAVIALCSYTVQTSCSLTALVLDDNVVKDEGAKHLCQMLQRNRKIAHLSMQNNFLGDKAASLFAKTLEKNKTLSFIGFQWNAITGVGAKCLAKGLLANTTLRSMALMGNQVDPESATWLVEASTQTITLQERPPSTPVGESVNDDGSVASSTIAPPPPASTVTRVIYLNLDIPFNEPRSKSDAFAEIEAFSYDNFDTDDAFAEVDSTSDEAKTILTSS